MSSVKLESNASGTGIFTIASPNSNTNRTLTLPDSTGTVLVSGGSQTIEFAAGSSSAPSITTTGDTNTGIFFPAADTIGFAGGGAEAMRIDSSGNVEIGSTSALYGSIFTVANSYQTKNGPIFVDTRNQGTGTGAMLNLGGKYNSGGDYRPFASIRGAKTNATDGNSEGYLTFETNNNGADPTERARITSDGKFLLNTANTTGQFNVSGDIYIFNMSTGAGTNAVKYNAGTGQLTYDTSSAKYKDNIRDSVYGLSHVIQMRSAQFEYKDTGRSDIGFIAEELDLVVPELVMKNQDNEPDSVCYDRMTSVLVKAIQELSAKNDALEARLAALENK